MKKWPKKWLDAVDSSRWMMDLPPEKALDRLHEIGALKEPPKPKEFFILDEPVWPKKAFNTIGELRTEPNWRSYEVIHVREVLDEEER